MSTEQQKRLYLDAKTLLRYFIGTDDELDTLVMCKSSEIGLVTSDASLYEALGSIKDYDNFKLNKLTKLLEVCDITSFEHGMKLKKPILTEKRVDELRNYALQEKIQQNKD